MIILVTGATGFVGSAVVRHLLEAGFEVRALVRPGRGRANIADLPLETIDGDLTDPPSLQKALNGCAALFHVAADYRLWAPDPHRMYLANVEGTRTLMLAALAAGVERIVYTSSVATLGKGAGGHPAQEADRGTFRQMIGHYKKSKFLAEGEVRRLIARRGLPAVIVSPSTPVGARDIRPTPTGRILVDAANGRMPAYVETGLNLVHVDDVAAGHLLAFRHGRVGDNYILGGENMALREILAAVAALTGRRPPRLRLPRRPLLPLACMAEGWARLSGGPEPRLTVAGVRMAAGPMFFSSEKAQRELGYRPRPAQAGLRDALDWFRRHGYCGGNP